MPDHFHGIAQEPEPPSVLVRADVTRITTHHVWVSGRGAVCGALDLGSTTVYFHSALQVRQLAAALPGLAARMEELAAGEGGDGG
jgi:hypothetical protein